MEKQSSCTLCPRLCHVNRSLGQRGFCQMGDTVQVARAAPHLWEEPCLCGPNGSGTVFFSGCPLRCVFCQNHTISHDGQGYPVTVERLADIFLSLEKQGVANLNLVTPTPWIPQIQEALTLAWKKGFWLPVVFNSSGYERVSTLTSLRGYISIYLPDFKYWSPEQGRLYSGVPDYPERAKRALYEMVNQRGEARFTKEGLMTRGVIVRHLVLPGQTDDSKHILSYLHQTYGHSIFISIMNQYTPMPGMTGPLARPLSEEEYREVVDYARSIGIRNAFIQEGGAVGESFIPDFHGEGIIESTTP